MRRETIEAFHEAGVDLSHKNVLRERQAAAMFEPPKTLDEARHRKAELTSQYQTICEQLSRRTAREFDSYDAFMDWQTRAKSARYNVQAKLSVLKPYMQSLNEAESARRSGERDNQLAQAAASLKAAEEELAALRGQVARPPDARVAALEAERDKLSAATVGNRVAIEFVEVARVVLGEQTFNRIMSRARDRVTTRP
jgi:hypothetical protein